ncbi:MAG: osmoprotectant transport system permease protein [Frankiaceae bacterium]|jgi:osmoprotectant transport system permease protein|nr:osmoprotectant transport system permease protein [Frankiaceae bacterium]
MSAWGQLVDYLTTTANWTGQAGILHRLEQHAALTGVSVAIAAAVALPLGLALGHHGRGGNLAINITNVGRAIPTFAVLTLLTLSPVGIGNTSTVIALILFALPPLVTNSYIGVREVDPEARDAARGMGMSGWQLFRRVELPLGMPLIMAGIRIATVQVVATATIAALVGAGGLGRLITDGLSSHNQGELLSGAVVVALLAVVVESGLALVQRRVDPVRRLRAGAGFEPGAVTTS